MAQTLSDLRLEPHYNIRSFVNETKVVPLTIRDLKYHSVGFWNEFTVGELSQSVQVHRGFENWQSTGTFALVQFSGSTVYNNLMQANVDTTGILITSITNTPDDLTTPPFDEAGTYYIELVFNNIGSNVDRAISYISFSSDENNNPSDTDKFFLSSSLNPLSGTLRQVFRINRDSLVNSDITNIKRIDIFLKTSSSIAVVTMEALRLVSSTYTYPDFNIDTKLGVFKYNPSQAGSRIHSDRAANQGDTTYFFNATTNKVKDFREIVKFRTGHLPTGVGEKDTLTLYLRAQIGVSEEFITATLETDFTSSALVVKEGADTLLSSTSFGALEEEKDYYFEAVLKDEHLTFFIREANGGRVGDVVYSSPVITTTILDPGYIGLAYDTYNADAEIDYAFMRDSVLAEYESDTFESLTPVRGVSLYPISSDAVSLIESDDLVEGPAVNPFDGVTYSDSGGEDDVLVEEDEFIMKDSPSSFKVSKHLRNAFIGGIQFNNLEINDPLNIRIEGDLRFSNNLANYGEFRIVLIDRDLENIVHITQINIADFLANTWNHFSIPILTDDIYQHELIVQIHHVGINEDYATDDTTAFGTFWLDNFKISTESVVWEASNDNGLTYIRFYDTLSKHYQGVNFPVNDTSLRVRARAYTTNAWINGYELYPHYSELGRVIE